MWKYDFRMISGGKTTCHSMIVKQYKLICISAVKNDPVRVPTSKPGATPQVNENVVSSQPIGPNLNSVRKSIPMVVLLPQATSDHTFIGFCSPPLDEIGTLTGFIASGSLNNQFCNPGALPQAVFYDPFRVW